MSIEPGGWTYPFVADQLAACSDSMVSPQPIRGDLRVDVDDICAQGSGHSRNHQAGIAVFHPQTPPLLGELAVEIGEAGDQEIATPRRTSVGESRIDDEENTNGPFLRGRHEGRVVVEADVAAQPAEGGHPGDSSAGPAATTHSSTWAQSR